MPRTHRKLPQFNPQDIQDFWGLADKTPGHGPWGDCWMVATPAGHWRRGIVISRTRVAYFLSTGIDPMELYVLHRCDIRKCVNPAHLFLGTQADNAADMVGKGRSAKGTRHRSHTHPESRPRGESHGHAKLTEEKVREVIRLLNEGWGCTNIGRYLGINRLTISSIKSGKAWSHIPRH